MTVGKTAFISYRRANSAHALLINEELKDHNYDVFLDVNSLGSGAFGQVILNQIAARAHFIVILTPSTVKRCAEPGDWVRKEIECAIELKRNIVPIMFDKFDYKKAARYLTGKLSTLPQYNSLLVDYNYFDAVVDKLVNQFLSAPLDLVIHPAPPKDEAIVQKNLAGANNLPLPTSDQLQAENYFEQGVLKIIQYQLNGAIADFTEAIRLNPGYDEAYYQRGRAFGNQRHKDEAIEDWQKAVELEPDDIRANITRSCIYREKGDFKRSLIEADAGVSLNPEDSDAYFQRGNVKRHLKDWDGAIADFTNAIEIIPEQANLYYFNRALTRSDKGDQVGALEDLQILQHQEPDFNRAKLLSAIIRRRMGDFATAITDLSELLSITPNDSSVYNNRGFTRYKMGDFENGLIDCLHACELEPKNKYPVVSVGQIYFSQGAIEKAQDYFKRALEIDKDYDCALAGLAACTFKLNQTELTGEIWRGILARGEDYKTLDWYFEKSEPDAILAEVAKESFALVLASLTST